MCHVRVNVWLSWQQRCSLNWSWVDPDGPWSCSVSCRVLVVLVPSWNPGIWVVAFHLGRIQPGFLLIISHSGAFDRQPASAQTSAPNGALVPALIPALPLHAPPGRWLPFNSRSLFSAPRGGEERSSLLRGTRLTLNKPWINDEEASSSHNPASRQSIHNGCGAAVQEPCTRSLRCMKRWWMSSPPAAAVCGTEEGSEVGTSLPRVRPAGGAPAWRRQTFWGSQQLLNRCLGERSRWEFTSGSETSGRRAVTISAKPHSPAADLSGWMCGEETGNSSKGRRSGGAFRCAKIPVLWPRCGRPASTLTLQAWTVHTAEAKCPRPAGRVQHLCCAVTLPAAGPSPRLLPSVARSDGRMLPSLDLKWTTWTPFCSILCSGDEGLTCFRSYFNSNLSLKHMSSEQIPL